MRITHREVIQTGEQELIDAITGDLDWRVMEDIFMKEHGLNMGEDVTYKNGDIVIHNNQIAYRLDYDVKVTLSVLVDRNGSCLSLTSSADMKKTADLDGDLLLDKPVELSSTDMDWVSKAVGETTLIDQDALPSSAGGSGVTGVITDEESLLPDIIIQKISQAVAEASDVMKDIN